MKTPEQRAHDLILRIRYSSSIARDEQGIADAIREAVAEAREECAALLPAGCSEECGSEHDATSCYRVLAARMRPIAAPPEPAPKYFAYVAPCE